MISRQRPDNDIVVAPGGPATPPLFARRPPTQRKAAFKPAGLSPAIESETILGGNLKSAIATAPLVISPKIPGPSGSVAGPKLTGSISSPGADVHTLDPVTPTSQPSPLSGPVIIPSISDVVPPLASSTNLQRGASGGSNTVCSNGSPVTRPSSSVTHSSAVETVIDMDGVFDSSQPLNPTRGPAHTSPMTPTTPPPPGSDAASRADSDPDLQQYKRTKDPDTQSGDVIFDSRIMLNDTVVHRRLIEVCRGEKLISSSKVCDLLDSPHG